MSETAPAPERPAHGTRWWVTRAVMLGITGISLYLLAPSLIALFSNLPQLRHLQPWWILAALGFETLSYVSLWELQRIALRTPSWFAVGTSQLAGAATGSLVPGGGATANAVAYRMLVRAGVDPAAVASGLTASLLATTATAFALPVLAAPAVLGGDAARGLVQTTYAGLAAFIALAVVGAVALLWDAPLRFVGRCVRAVLAHTRKRESSRDLPDRLLAQRDTIRIAFGSRWRRALTAAVGKWGFDYLALVCCLAAVGTRPDSSLVLLAYAGSALLGMIPLTPGGLGFVETGLTGLLVLAGVSARASAVAALAYRLVSFWLPMPVGGVAVLLHRRRYGNASVSPG
jgi:uncharacterized protein (TIRG00374 family)